MTGSPEVLAALLALHQECERQKDALRVQKYYWRSTAFKHLACWWDCVKLHLDEVHHHVLKRIFALGDMPAGATPDETAAFTAALAGFARLRELTIAACEAAEADSDVGTEELLEDAVKAVEKCVFKAEKQLGALAKLKSVPYMSEQM